MPDDPETVLLVDHDHDRSEGLSTELRREGFRVLQAPTGDQALQSWRADDPDVILLEARLPDQLGVEVCRTIFQQSVRTRLVVMSSDDDEATIVRAFREGADDYIVKPFSPRVLVARLHAVLKRGASPTRRADPRVIAGPFILDPEIREVTRDELVARLTQSEFGILQQLALNAGRVVTYEHLAAVALGCDHGTGTALKSHISHIRDKLHVTRGEPGDITAVHGLGYRLQV